jgi:hypothetical protein
MNTRRDMKGWVHDSLIGVGRSAFDAHLEHADLMEMHLTHLAMDEKDLCYMRTWVEWLGHDYTRSGPIHPW